MKAKITLYNNIRRIELVETNNLVRNYNEPMNRNDFILYKGAGSTIEFQIRNVDRKFINLENRSLHFYMIDFKTKKTVLSKKLEIVDSKKGICKIVFTPYDTTNIEPKYYSYCVFTDSNNNQELLMTDINQQSRGYIEIRDGVIPSLYLSYEIIVDPIEDNFTIVSANEENKIKHFYSSAYPGDAQSSSPNGLHTAAIYMENFTGKLWIQGTLLNSVPDNEWFNIDVGYGEYISYNNCSGIDVHNFDANTTWTRFVIEQADLNEGKVKKILYRN